MIHFTIADKAHEGLRILKHSTERLGIETRILGLGTRQAIGHGKNGFGLKLSALKEAVSELPAEQFVLFTDAFDVIVQASLDPLEQWLQNNQAVLFAAETVNWPDKTLAYPVPCGFIPFLNSGVFAGRAGHILELLQQPFTATTDDQYYYASQFVTGKSRIVLDSGAEYFLCFHAMPGTIEFKDMIRFLPAIGPPTTPPVLHFNNGVSRFKWYETCATHVLGPWARFPAREVAYKIVPYWEHRFRVVVLAIVLIALCMTCGIQ
jgi:hypothetical protein